MSTSPLFDPAVPPTPVAGHAHASTRPGTLRSWLGAVVSDPARLALAGALLVGVLVRGALVLASDFPLNDGALFLQMARAVRDAHYRLPAYVGYNGVAVPFAYPPLGFYLVAALHDLLRLDMVQALRLVPFAAASACLVAFAAFARDLLPRVTRGVTDPAAVLPAAVLAFALLPRSYSWLLMGGGLTRSLGLLFATLALHQAYLLYARARWTHAALLGGFAGLTALSHIGTVPFTAFSITLLFLAYGRHRVGVLGSAGALALALTLAAPWAAAVVAHHGWGPFLAARVSGGSTLQNAEARFSVVMRLATFGIDTTGEALFPLIAVLAFLGAVASARGLQLLLPVWWASIFVLDARAPGTYASIPVSLLAGIGVAAILLPLLFPRGPRAAPADAASLEGEALGRWVPRAVAGGLIAYALAAALTRSSSVGGEGNLLVGLRPEDRAAMAWVARSTPRDARFVVLTGPKHAGIWGDRVSEWFPVLAGRVSVATLQGREWINDGTFQRREGDYDRLQECVGATPACLDAWSRSTGESYTHVFVSKDPTLTGAVPLLSALRADPAFRVVSDGPGALIAERRPR